MASAGATGAESSAAFAAASNIAGQERAATQAAATGAGATTFGVSQAAGQVVVCYDGGPSYSASQCRTLAPNFRATNCTDVPPDDRFTCTQQAVDYKKCDAGFMFLGAFCLRSCDRCRGE